jgi:hypothetical protein
MQDDGPLAEQIRWHMIQFARAFSGSNHADMDVLRQQVDGLLAQYISEHRDTAHTA